jgi:hypothetical protein
MAIAAFLSPMLLLLRAHTVHLTAIRACAPGETTFSIPAVLKAAAEAVVHG